MTAAWAMVAAALSLTVAGAARADKVDDIVRAGLADQGIPGASVAVIRNGRVAKTAGYGLANVELGVKATPRTVFQIQSMTKSFTAAGILMLVEEGKVGLDDPISKYVDGTPDSWKDITIRHLLTHTSGIKDYINEPTRSLRLEVSDDDIVKAAAPRPLNFAPGDRYAYSNTNYLLLGMVIRRVTGAFYGDFLNERIFEPLGMKDTRVISLTAIIPNRASGYLLDNAGLRNGEYVAGSVLGYPGGGLRSTVLDLAKWDIALTEGRILKPGTRALMWSKAKLNDGSESGYGFGWAIGEANGRRVLSHTGSHGTGFASVIQRYPDDGLSVIILSNLGGADVSSIARKVAARYLRLPDGP